MCDFASWKEIRCPDGSTQVLFLTHDDIFNTSRGLELRNHTTVDDLVGHGAIAFYYEIDTNKGINKECTDFLSPENFPPEIVEALKNGKMWGMVDYFPEGLLRAPLDADYKAKRAPLYADYEAKRDVLYADYKAKRAPLDADYKAKRDVLLGEQWGLFLDPDNRSEAWK
jgi:hypothetical protein